MRMLASLLYLKKIDQGVFSKNILVELAINFWTKASNGVAAYAVENELKPNDTRIDKKLSLLWM